MNRPLLVIILCSLAIKAWLSFGVVKSYQMSWDEESAWAVAENKNAGHDYSLYDTESKSYRKTAFHGAFTVLIYDALIQYHISKTSWIIFVYVLTFACFVLSVIYFYKLCALFTGHEKTRLFCTATYVFYPSVIYYVGALFLYENISTYLLIIALYWLIKNRTENFKAAEVILLPLIVCTSCLFRPHLIVVYAIVFLVYLLCTYQKQLRLKLIIAAASVLMTGLAFIPTLQKNKKLFGVYTLSTQTGFELLQGHNPNARGSWLHHWEESHNVLFQYTHAHIPGLDTMNEYASSKARQQLAISWALENPGKEIALTARKVAIYFLPANFEELPENIFLNGITAIIHVLFIFGLLFMAFTKQLTRNHLILLAPVIASLLLTIIFYTGMRWRFYAEPFMILMAWIGIEKMRSGMMRGEI